MWWKRLLIAALIAITLPFAARVYVHFYARDHVYSVTDVPHCRVAMVLGSRVLPDGSLSVYLAGRVDRAIELYKAGKCEKLLMSGDNRFRNYNEPERMREYAIRKGVPAEDVGVDFAGRRTYDSVYRAQHIFGLQRLIIVTQAFHVDRAVFLANHLGLKAYGVASDNKANTRATFREFPACVSALADAYLLHPHPVMGEKEEI